MMFLQLKVDLCNSQKYMWLHAIYTDEATPFLLPSSIQKIADDNFKDNYQGRLVNWVPGSDISALISLMVDIFS